MSTIVVENPNPTFVVVKDSSAANTVIVSKVSHSIELTNNQSVVITQVVYNTPIEGQAGDTIVITNPPEFAVEVGAQGPQGAQGPAGPQGPAGAPGASSEDLEVVVRNNTGSTLLRGQVVYVTGALGQKPTVALASAAAETTSSKSFGFVKTDISNNTEGIIVNFGFLHDVDTSAFEEGQALYLSTTPGQATNVKPSAPTHLVSLGWVVKKAGGAGSIFVQIQNGFELYELHNVSLVTSRDGQVLEYDGLASLWKNKSPDKSPVFTYTSGLLTRVDYASGNYKLLTYTGSVLTQLVYVLPGRTVTKAFTYNLDGSLASISQSEVYN